ncbi:putative Nudix hydrolase NudL [Clavelina lepadiformis]|uniref:putative Nudix hydrolase NudL n=1 Tax=Clavelina lepadiformis TaxID=159417 RepID=UPI00404101A8
MDWAGIEARLAQLEIQNLPFLEKIKIYWPKRRASVLVPLFHFDGKVYVLLTKRSDKLTSHSGDVCFPGGKQDEDDASLIQTALREAEEEVGLKSEHVHVLGSMIPFFSYTKLLVFPIICRLKNLDQIRLTINRDEVDAVFACPLDFFLSNSNHRFVKSKLDDVMLHVYNWFVPSVPTFLENNFLQTVFGCGEHSHFIIYGLTAQMALLVAVFFWNKSIEFGGNIFEISQFLNEQKKYLQKKILHVLEITETSKL